jgi:cell division protein ZapA
MTRRMAAKQPSPPSGERPVTLDVALLGREYKVACKDSERAELLDAVALLDRRMRDIRDGGKIVGTDRIAVMAALNLAHDLLRARKSGGVPAPADANVEATSSFAIDDAGARRRISAMRASIEEVLGGQDKLF